MANKKRISIGDKRIPASEEIDTLFSNNYITNDTSRLETTENTSVQKNKSTPILRKVEDMRKYYKESKGGKQVSIYLPEEIHQLVKINATKDNKAMATLIKNLVIDHLEDSEIKEAYKKKIESNEN